MIPCLTLALSFTSALSVTSPIPQQTEPPRRPKVLMIGLDGVRPDALQAADAPALHRLAREGTADWGAQTCARTVSGPSWSCMLTGVWTEKHGVTGNGFQDHRLREWPPIFARIEAFDSGLDTRCVAHWRPIHTYHGPFADGTEDANSVAEAAARTLRVLDQEDPDFLFVHFDGADHAGHTYGYSPEIPEYMAAIASIDREIARLRGALEARPGFAGEDWLILVSTDHGGSGTSHGRDEPAHRTIFNIAHGGAYRGGGRIQGSQVVDLVPTALTHLGIPIDPAWQLDGKPLQAIAPPVVAELDAAPARRPPNVVVLLVDDLGWADLGVHGSDLYETPHIDRLAAQSLRFANAYAAAPVCSPSRAALLTGKDPARLRITDWIPGVRWPNAALRTPEFVLALPLEERTLAEALAPAGYQSWHVGKWHLGPEGYYPLDQGFDVNVGGHEKGAPGSYFYPFAKKTEQTDWSVVNLPPGGAEGDYLTDVLTNHAVDLIRGAGAQPFFLHMSYYAVHTPIEGKPEKIEHYRAKKRAHPGTRQHHAGYAAMVESLDESVGRILAVLEERGVAQDTVVIFTSDNGGVEGITRNDPLRAYKGFLYEGGIREPFFVRWPGHVAAGECDEPVTGTDVFPTIAALAGVPVGEGLDGHDLGPLLRDPAAALDRDALFWHYPHYHTSGRPPCGAVRAGRWKLIEWYEDGRLELYDLQVDPGEMHDLAAALPAKAAALRDRLHAKLAEQDAQMPAPNPDHDPARPFAGAWTAWKLMEPR